ncbi:MAG: cell filamentation protein Fic [Hyphomicrobium sp.]|nr:MAG: cell filamentation protein Fic [Hyphomicrobium sp.]
MAKDRTDKEAAMLAAPDRGEDIGLMEPLVISEGSRHRSGLTDLALELAQRAAGFRKSMPDGVVTALAELVRAMNCYYSNLIEGHDTHPIEIERALKNDYSADPEKRNLQLEAKAHISVQRWIDEGSLDGRALSSEGIREVHRRFCAELPDELLWVEYPSTGERVRVVPGKYRERDVQVGRHIAVSPGAVPRFMQRFEQGYGRLGNVDTILAAATAHHRLAWIHPFLDGNGRVMRLMSHSILRERLDTGGVWSIARGLARNVDAYKGHLAACDLPRRNDLDGRGNLSEETLAEFASFFLTVCIDQVKFMEDLMQPDRLRSRILLWAEEEIRLDHLPPKAGSVLEALLYRGALPRGDVAALLDTSPRSARRAIAALIEKGAVVSESSRAPLVLSFPATLASRWMPGLFPDK